ncbi:hypothetical protein BT96DRAFT_1008628 [Gymnopus androsaceus JB14]|uniref:Uncharacterized protein n=1 Tax=Gymnopus androsaceus JB14 TaxID=1447944 RepID=A0A6A4GEQ3_9AGAR|nr:hypothetical protein BT96DRAFT_1008628 [Gymnopus androsaceus JB14]
MILGILGAIGVGLILWWTMRMKPKVPYEEEAISTRRTNITRKSKSLHLANAPKITPFNPLTSQDVAGPCFVHTPETNMRIATRLSNGIWQFSEPQRGLLGQSNPFKPLLQVLLNQRTRSPSPGPTYLSPISMYSPTNPFSDPSVVSPIDQQHNPFNSHADATDLETKICISDDDVQTVPIHTTRSSYRSDATQAQSVYRGTIYDLQKLHSIYSSLIASTGAGPSYPCRYSHLDERDTGTQGKTSAGSGERAYEEGALAPYHPDLDEVIDVAPPGHEDSPLIWISIPISPVSGGRMESFLHMHQCQKLNPSLIREGIRMRELLRLQSDSYSHNVAASSSECYPHTIPSSESQSAHALLTSTNAYASSTHPITLMRPPASLRRPCIWEVWVILRGRGRGAREGSISTYDTETETTNTHARDREMQRIRVEHPDMRSLDDNAASASVAGFPTSPSSFATTFMASSSLTMLIAGHTQTHSVTMLTLPSNGSHASGFPASPSPMATSFTYAQSHSTVGTKGILRTYYSSLAVKSTYTWSIDGIAALCKRAIQTIDGLSKRVNFSDYALRIVHPLVRVLDSANQDVRKAVLDTVCSLAIQLGSDFRHLRAHDYQGSVEKSNHSYSLQGPHI